MYIKGTYIKPCTIIAYVPPFTIIQPKGATIGEGGTHTFSVRVIGSPPFTYRWYKNGVPITTATDKDFVITNATTNDDADYYCIISNNKHSLQTITVKLNVLKYPVIIKQPVSIRANPNTTIYFDTSANGSDPLTYSWYKEDTLVSSSTNNLLYIYNTQKLDIANYYCVISNLIGSVTSNTVRLTLNEPLSVVKLPNNITLNPGKTLNTYLSCTGTTPITAEWRRDGVACKPITVYPTGSIPLIINNIQVINDGTYDCVLTNIVGTITSNSFIVHINRPLEFILQPLSGLVDVGDSYTFTADASGSEPILYKWIKINPYVDLNVIGKSLTLDNIDVDNQAKYACVATNAIGSLTSLVVQLSVNSNYLITRNTNYVLLSTNTYWHLS
jgi:hypothetical protein